MKIISWNVNGIRSVYKKGFLKFIKKYDPDILCLQEIRAGKEQFPKELINLNNYFFYINSSRKKGRAGVAIYTKEKPIDVDNIFGYKYFDREGRFLRLDFKNFILINLYFPHGGRKKERLNYKLKIYDYFLNFAKKNKNKKIVLVGDFNIAHKDIDLTRPKQNKNNIMFTKEERKILDRLVSLNFIDSFRKLNPKKIQYTWWPYFANARERNLGWRIDYIFVSGVLFNKVKKSFILNEVIGSDHCPIGIELK